MQPIISVIMRPIIVTMTEIKGGGRKHAGNYKKKWLFSASKYGDEDPGTLSHAPALASSPLVC